MKLAPETIESITSSVSQFRAAIDDYMVNETGFYRDRLLGFPQRHCHLATRLVMIHLQKAGFGKADYVWGKYKFASPTVTNCGEQSHAWAELGCLIVDISADQFEEDHMPKIVVEVAHPYYDRFQPTHRDFYDKDKSDLGEKWQEHVDLCEAIINRTKPDHA